MYSITAAVFTILIHVGCNPQILQESYSADVWKSNPTAEGKSCIFLGFFLVVFFYYYHSIVKMFLNPLKTND